MLKNNSETNIQHRNYELDKLENINNQLIQEK